MAHGRRRRGALRGGQRRTRRSGQSTLEYLLLLVAFVAMVGALALLWHAARDGRLLELSVDAASHSSGGGMTSLLKDVLEY